MEVSLVGLRSSMFRVRAAPRKAGSALFSTVHSLVAESSGLYQELPIRRRVPFSGSEHTQFSVSSLQRRSAAYEGEVDSSSAKKTIKSAIVALAESMTTSPVHTRRIHIC